MGDVAKIRPRDVDRASIKEDNSDQRGGGGGGGNMTERIERLEKKVEAIDSALSRLSESMVRIEGKFDVIALKFDGIDKKFDSITNSLTDKIELSNKTISDKIDSSVKLNESTTRANIAEAKLAIILAIPAIIGAVYTAYRLLSKQ